jgi:hypothetical protein
MLTDAKSTGLFIALMSLGILLSTAFVILLMYSTKTFLLLFVAYVLAYSTYIVIIMSISRKDLKGAKWEAGYFLTMFNIVFNVAVIILLSWMLMHNSLRLT